MPEAPFNPGPDLPLEREFEYLQRAEEEMNAAADRALTAEAEQIILTAETAHRLIDNLPTKIASELVEFAAHDPVAEAEPYTRAYAKELQELDSLDSTPAPRSKPSPEDRAAAYYELKKAGDDPVDIAATKARIAALYHIEIDPADTEIDPTDTSQ